MHRRAKHVLFVASLLAVVLHATPSKADVCAFGGAIVPMSVLAATVGGFPAYGKASGHHSLGFGAGPSHLFAGENGGGITGEARVDLLVEAERHGLRATGYYQNSPRSCDYPMLQNLSLAYSNAVLKTRRTVVRLEVGLHGGIIAFGPTLGIEYERLLTEAIIFGTRLRLLPTLIFSNHPVARLETKFKFWATRGVYPYISAIAGNKPFPVDEPGAEDLPNFFAEGVLGLGYRWN